VIRIFPNPKSCLWLIRALVVEIHEGWLPQYGSAGRAEKEPIARLGIGCSMNHQQSFLKVRLSSPIKLGALSAPKPTRFGGNGKASRNAIVLFSKKTKSDPAHLLRFLFAELDTRN
jgi:hypothetical protein